MQLCIIYQRLNTTDRNFECTNLVGVEIADSEVDGSGRVVDGVLYTQISGDHCFLYTTRAEKDIGQVEHGLTLSQPIRTRVTRLLTNRHSRHNIHNYSTAETQYCTKMNNLTNNRHIYMRLTFVKLLKQPIGERVTKLSTNESARTLLWCKGREYANRTQSTASLGRPKNLQ